MTRPTPLPAITGLTERTFVKGRPLKHGVFEQREQEWKASVEWLKKMITVSRDKGGLGWHPYAVETEDIKELINEAFNGENV